MQLSHRTLPFQESVIREMTRLGDETSSINLSQGLPDFDTPQEVLEAAVEAIRRGDNQYTFPFGSPPFRQAIATKTLVYNHIQADPESEVTVTCGVSEAVMATILALTEPGDEAILLEPWYENYLPGCLMAGVTPRFVPLHEPEYTFDFDELRKAFNSRTRLIFINTPHNPTGRVFTQPELNEISALCLEYDVIAICDEIYEHIYYAGHSHISLGSLAGMRDRIVTISGLGKTYSVTGWRVGWAVAAEAISALIRKVHDYLTICAPAPFQSAGIAALQLPDYYYDRMRADYNQCKEILLAGLDGAGLKYCIPEGAYYVMADFNQVQWDRRAYMQGNWSLDRAFAEYMARHVGVAVVPGSSFYNRKENGETRVRFNFARREDTLREAAARLLRLR
jgi:aspartate/methionine/tyrosine aminotransferase